MEKINILLLVSLIALLWVGCEEIPPEINPIMEVDSGVCPEPASIEGQLRQVLIEEFTGVRCVNCPAGSAAIEELLVEHGSQLVAVSIHAGSFSPPYPESNDTLRTIAGENILSLLGQPLGYPTAVINRKQFQGGFGLQLGRNSWPGAIEEELLVPPAVALAISTSYEESSRQLEVCVTINGKEAITEEDVRLTVVLTENDVVDAQLTPASSAPDLNYRHQHVLRAVLTGSAGNLIQEPLVAGSLIQKAFSTTLSEKWRAGNCKIAAFVHLGGTDMQVLQAHEVKAVE